MNRFSKLALTALLLLATACGGSKSKSEGESDYEGKSDSGQRATTWTELSYAYSPTGTRNGCEFSEVRVNANYQFTYKDCRGERTGWIKQDKVAGLKEAAKNALKATGKQLKCSLLGLKSAMSLGLRPSANGPAVPLRKFEAARDCVRGESDATEALNAFMAELLEQLSRR